MDAAIPDRREQARWIILIAAVSGALYLCWLMLKPFIGILLWAAVLALTFAPVHRRVLARVRRPALAAGLTCVLVLLLVGLPTTFIVWATLREAGAVIASLQQTIGELMDPDSRATGAVVQWLDDRIDVQRTREQVTTYLGTLGSDLAARTLNLVQDAVIAAVEALFVMFVMFYMLRDGTAMRGALASAIPLHNRQTYAMLLRVREVVAASIYGGVVIAGIQGTLGGLAFWALGVPSPLMWGIVMVFLALVGAFLVWIPAVIYLAIQGSWIKAIVLAVWGVFVIGLVDNFLRPRLVGKRTELHELFIFFAVLGGLRMFGVLGIVLGPVALAVALSLLEAFRYPDRATASSASLPVAP